MRLITPLGACAQGQCRNVCKPHDALDSFLGTHSFIQDDAQPVAALAIHILTPVWNPSFAVSAYNNNNNNNNNNWNLYSAFSIHKMFKSAAHCHSLSNSPQRLNGRA